MLDCKVTLVAGIPDDNNRDYLPEKLKNSTIVVNENGNNSQPYPKRLTEHRAVLTADGQEDVWYEYIPASYDPQRKVPLVVSMHGGLMTGWAQAVYTSWTLTAERAGFIVVFPNASDGRVWSVKWGAWENGQDAEQPPPPGVDVAPENVQDNHDMQMTLALIEKMKQNYNIDEGRIFMQGMSMGNLMTSQFARHFGSLLAGAAGSGCATFLSVLFDENGRLQNKGGPLDIWQSRPELNDIPPQKQLALKVNKYNRLYWMRLNECGPLPQISIRGEDNFAFYTGKKADVVYLDIKNRDHGQTFDDAALVWDYLFSGARRLPDGTVTHGPTVCPRVGDVFAIALVQGCSNAWFQNKIIPMGGPAVRWQKLKYHGLNGGQKVRGEYLCVPVAFLAEAFGGVLQTEQGGLRAVMTLPDGRVLQFARGSIGCVIDTTLRSMYCEALYRDGQLLVSAEWFCRALLNLHVSVCGEAMYCTDHDAALSENMADLICDLLRGDAVPAGYGDLLQETK